MYVIFPAVDVVDESYLSLVAQENENPPPTGLRPSQNNTPAGPSPVPPTFHDTRPEQLRAEYEIARQNAEANGDHLSIPIPHLTQLQVCKIKYLANLHKTSGLCYIIFFILTCFHLTNYFGEENFSWLPSKNKVADGKN